MLAPSASAPHRASPLPSALLAAELGPAVMADDPCEAAFGSADPTGPRNYYRARYYDPKLGRFISEDPIGFQGGINVYTYVLNSPLNLVDPSGLWAIAPPNPNLNTMIGNGFGGITTQVPQLQHWNGAQRACLGQCTILHELTHLKEAQ